MATLSVPSPDLVSNSFSTNRPGIRRPLSTHGMPKEPRALSPERPHRFSALGLPSPAGSSFPGSPMSPGPMSPPMSAKSFGTFIDSEPSTPAYSPRTDHGWDSSTLVLLRPTSSSSEPSSPTEPTWNMMVPLKVPPRTTVTQGRSTEPPITTKEISATTSLSSHPTKQPKSAKRPKEIKIVDVSQRESLITKESNLSAPETNKTHEEQTPVTSPAPFGKLASKMKFMLRRRSTDNKKKQKKEKEQIEVDRIEDVHWTEM